jgi:hypothetical protein
MSARAARRTAHALAGTVAFATVLAFLLSTLAVELFGSAPAIAAVKAAIVKGLFLLVPALAIAGATGFASVGPHPKGPAATKLRRMKVIAPNGILILIPAAVFLNWKAQAGEFDLVFAIVQAVELAAGSLNLVLLGLNMRDGFRMTRRFKRSPGPRPEVPSPV